MTPSFLRTWIAVLSACFHLIKKPSAWPQTQIINTWNLNKYENVCKNEAFENNRHIRKLWKQFFFWKLMNNSFWASLFAFLSGFEHGVVFFSILEIDYAFMTLMFFSFICSSKGWRLIKIKLLKAREYEHRFLLVLSFRNHG